jgi:hypothetical protein
MDSHNSARDKDNCYQADEDLETAGAAEVLRQPFSISTYCFAPFSAIALHTFAGDMGSSVIRTPTAR